MKKLITLLLVLTGMVCTASAENNKTVYFKPWTGDDSWATNARFALYMFAQSGETVTAFAWADFSQMGSTGIYSVVIDVDTYNKMIICRMNGATTENDWDNKWNQSADLDAPTNNIYYNISNTTVWNKWDASTTNVTTKTIYDNVVLVGNRHITNGHVEWTATDDNKLTMNSETGINELTVTGATLEIGTYEYKYLCDGSIWYPSDNQKFRNYVNQKFQSINFQFNQFEGTIPDVTYSSQQGTQNNVEFKYYVKEDNGNPVTGKDWSDNLMTVSGDNATLTATKALEGGTDYKFKIVEETYFNNVKQYEYEASNNGDFWKFTPENSTTYNVTFTHAINRNTYEFTANSVYATTALVPDQYYFIISDGSWKVGEMLTEKSAGVFNGKISNWKEKRFAVAPSSALSGAWDWGKVIRPITDSFDDKDFWVNFQNFTNAPAVTAEDAENRYDATWLVKFDGDVDFTFDRTNKKWTLSSSFTRTLPAAAEGYATFSSDYDVLVPAGLTAKYAEDVDAANGTISLVNYPATGIKAGQGALLSGGVAGDDYTFTPATEAVAPTTNYLKPVGSAYANAVLPQTDGSNTNFVLAKVNNQLGFYKVADGGSWVNVGTAYLQVPGTLAREFYAWDEDVTAVEAVKQTQKMEGTVYNLAGQRIAQPTKGLYIVNGKKVMMK